MLVEAGSEHLCSQPDVLPQAELVDAAAEVLEEHLLRREGLRPVDGLEERVAVEVAGDVHPAAGIGVLEPGATDLVVLVEDDHVEARLDEPVRRHDARHARTDDGDAEMTVRSDLGRVPVRRAQIGAVELQLFAQQAGHVGTGLTGEEPEQLG